MHCSHAKHTEWWFIILVQIVEFGAEIRDYSDTYEIHKQYKHIYMYINNTRELLVIVRKTFLLKIGKYILAKQRDTINPIEINSKQNVLILNHGPCVRTK